MFKNVARFLKNSTGKGVKKMRKLIVILPVIMLVGAMAATYAFAISDAVTVSASVTQALAISIAIKDAQTAGADLTAVSFGTVPITPTDHRTKQTSPAGGAWVDYFVGAGTHEIRVWFDNYPATVSDPTKALAGLKATVGLPPTDYFWRVKVWSANYGPAGYNDATGGADPENDTYWGNNYSWILEKAYKVDGFGNTGLPAGYPAGIYKDETRTKLAWNYPTGTAIRTPANNAAPLDSRFRVDLAIDSLDAEYAAATATSYSGTLTFDLTQAP